MTTDTRTDKRRRLTLDLDQLRDRAREYTRLVNTYPDPGDARPVLLYVGNGVHAGADMGKDRTGARWFGLAGAVPVSANRKPPAVYTLDGSEWTCGGLVVSGACGPAAAWALEEWTGRRAIDANDYHHGRKVTRPRMAVRVEEVTP